MIQFLSVVLTTGNRRGLRFFVTIGGSFPPSRHFRHFPALSFPSEIANIWAFPFRGRSACNPDALSWAGDGWSLIYPFPPFRGTSYGPGHSEATGLRKPHNPPSSIMASPSRVPAPTEGYHQPVLFSVSGSHFGQSWEPKGLANVSLMYAREAKCLPLSGQMSRLNC